MAGRILTIKPELIEDEKTAGLSGNGFRLFVGLILLSDDYGNGRSNTEYLHGQVFWAAQGCTAVSTEAALSELHSAELVSFYEVRAQKYLHINGWEKHQKVDNPSRPRVPLHKSIDIVASTLDSDLIPPTTDHDPDHDRTLERLYQMYPRKEGKTRGMPIAMKLRVDELPMLELAITNYSKQVMGKERQFIKLFSTFMGCWKDYLEVEVTSPSPYRPIPKPTEIPFEDRPTQEDWTKMKAGHFRKLGETGQS